MNLTKKLIAVLTLAVLFFTFLDSPFAEANSEPIIESKETDNSIELWWNLEGDFFEIYRDQELIWSGTETYFKDTNLESDYLYSYRIGSYNKNNELIDISNLKTKTSNSEVKNFSTNSTNNGEEISTKLTSNVGLDYVRLEWGHLETKDGLYNIYRDEELIGSTKDLTYLDENVEPGKYYTYKIEAKKEISKQEKEEINSYIKENNLKLSKEDKEELFLKPHVLIRTVETNKEITQSELKSKDLPSPLIINEEDLLKATSSTSINSIKYSLLFRYTTFIPQKTVKNIHPLDLGTYLGGDNRSWGFFNNRYRTRSDVYAGWAGGTSELRQVRSVGESILYADEAGTQIIKRDRASTSGIRLTRDQVSSSRIMWRVNHSVGVPFRASYPNIAYYYEGTLYSNYSISLRGSHDRAPNHEFAFALAYTEDTPIRIFNYTGGSFFNLAPGAPQTYFEFSM
ncbi:hypothetical protein E2L07_04885 [Halalkalibacterium halodurans]|uniref:hypothetical protein n=1 Tax=Halalkalibacterium halodurans TaxID=86665 RepID=UPI0010676FAA|nr:hypothetical protein [Halalkalibacterium halodurans]TES56527.1 hypothetical protein E2L07_04885 [Halalkalibacterium halodurans]